MCMEVIQRQTGGVRCVIMCSLTEEGIVRSVEVGRDSCLLTVDAVDANQSGDAVTPSHRILRVPQGRSSSTVILRLAQRSQARPPLAAYGGSGGPARRGCPYRARGDAEGSREDVGQRPLKSTQILQELQIFSGDST